MWFLYAKIIIILLSAFYVAYFAVAPWKSSLKINFLIIYINDVNMEMQPILRNQLDGKRKLSLCAILVYFDTKCGNPIYYNLVLL